MLEHEKPVDQNTKEKPLPKRNKNALEYQLLPHQDRPDKKTDETERAAQSRSQRSIKKKNSQKRRCLRIDRRHNRIPGSPRNAGCRGHEYKIDAEGHWEGLGVRGLKAGGSQAGGTLLEDCIGLEFERDLVAWATDGGGARTSVSQTWRIDK